MPRVPVPPEVAEFLSRPNPAVIATLRPDGSPHTVPTWYDWEDGRVLVNMEATRLRLSFLRRDPRAALTALDEQSWYRHVSVIGRVVSIEEDAELADIDRLSVRYSGRPFSRRDANRVSAWLEPERWHGWFDAGPWPCRSSRPPSHRRRRSRSPSVAARSPPRRSDAARWDRARLLLSAHLP